MIWQSPVSIVSWELMASKLELSKSFISIFNPLEDDVNATCQAYVIWLDSYRDSALTSCYTTNKRFLLLGGNIS